MSVFCVFTYSISTSCLSIVQSKAIDVTENNPNMRVVSASALCSGLIRLEFVGPVLVVPPLGLFLDIRFWND